jgi:hypothetical protein
MWFSRLALASPFLIFNVAYHVQTEDALTLLNTNDGEYAAACAMDYAKPPKYYDTFALRDAEGAVTIMQTWPYFRSSASRYAMKKNRPVPVASCWNGMGKLIYFQACPNARQWNSGSTTGAISHCSAFSFSKNLGQRFADPCSPPSLASYTSSLMLSFSF